MTTDLATMSYGDIVAALRKDLLLDLSTDVLAGDYAALLHLGIDRGNNALTWPGASQFSNIISVPHRLGAIPSAIVATAQLTAGHESVEMHFTSAFSATVASFWGHTTDGSLPANTVTSPFFWAAFR